MSEKVLSNMELLKEMENIRAENDKLKEELSFNNHLIQQIGRLGYWINIVSNFQVIWSDTVYDIFGYQRDELSPREIFNRHLHEEDKDFYWKHIKQSLESKK